MFKLTHSDRTIIGHLATALYAANDDETFHALQDRTFGIVADALIHTVDGIATREVGDMDIDTFRDEFFAAWGGEVGDSAASLVQAILDCHIASAQAWATS